MGVYQIIGGTPLCGVVRVHGAKNSVLPILAGTLAVKGQFVIENCPNISDVNAAMAILQSLGCTAERFGDSIRVDSRPANRTEIPKELMQTMRAAILFLGALLCRFGEAILYQPGGCVLGERPIDLHLMGLRLMGVTCETEGERLLCRATKLEGCTVALPFPSVGATENLLLAALGCNGSVTICNAAREPEIGDFIGFLQACGADIRGTNTPILQITGGRHLHDSTYTVMADRIVAATYLCAGAITYGEMELRQVYFPHFAPVAQKLEESGCILRKTDFGVIIQGKRLRAVSPIITAPYPEFPTDAQAILMSVVSLAEGTTVFEENIFSDRFRHVPALQAMGANIQTTKHYAVVNGVKHLQGAKISATDLRGGAAMALAALAAEGESILTDTAHIERGYGDFVAVLRSCGAQITQKDCQMYGRQEKETASEETGAEASAQLSGCENGAAASSGTCIRAGAAGSAGAAGAASP